MFVVNLSQKVYGVTAAMISFIKNDNYDITKECPFCTTIISSIVGTEYSRLYRYACGTEIYYKKGNSDIYLSHKCFNFKVPKPGV